MVIHRIFSNLTVKFITSHFLVEQRNVKIIKHYTVFIEGEYLILICTNIDHIAKMVFVFCFTRFFCNLFIRSSRKNFSVPFSFFYFSSFDFLFFKPFRILFFFFCIQVSIHTDKFANTSSNLIPIQQNFWSIFSISLIYTNSFCIVPSAISLMTSCE